MRRRGKKQQLLCEQCGAAVDGKSRYCGECGAEIPHRVRRVEIRDEYAGRIFTYGCLTTLGVAMVVGLIAGMFSAYLGLGVAFAIILGGIVFMRLLFAQPK